MPYGRRYGRRRPRRRRNTRRRSKSRRHTTGFKTSSRFKAKTARGRRAVRRAGKIACPVVYECLKKIADYNICYNIKDCEGIMKTTSDLFAGSNDLLQVQGPFSAGTGESIDRCGYLCPGNIYVNPVAEVTFGLGTMSTEMNPSSTLYTNIPLDFQCFPLLAMTNPDAGALVNGSNARDSSKAMINYFDNRHSLRIMWPSVSSFTTDGIYMLMKRARLLMHEVLYWIPDIGTVVTNKLVVAAADWTNVTAVQAFLRTQRTWLRRMYNAKFATHPLADATISDVIDITTSAPTNAFDTFNEPIAAASRVQNNNLKPGWKDTKEFTAAGVLDRRKDARVVWQRKRTYRRPRFSAVYAGDGISIPPHSSGVPLTTNGNVATEDGTDTTTATEALANSAKGVSLPLEIQTIRCGKKFNIDKPLEWEATIEDADPDSAIREVCPRGVYCYCKYWFYDPGLIDSTTANATFAPDISAAFTGKVDKTMVLKFQNI